MKVNNCIVGATSQKVLDFTKLIHKVINKLQTDSTISGTNAQKSYCIGDDEGQMTYARFLDIYEVTQLTHFI